MFRHAESVRKYNYCNYRPLDASSGNGCHAWHHSLFSMGGAEHRRNTTTQISSNSGGSFIDVRLFWIFTFIWQEHSALPYQLFDNVFVLSCPWRNDSFLQISSSSFWVLAVGLLGFYLCYGLFRFPSVNQRLFSEEKEMTNVIQQSSGSQTPELQGDADRVLVRCQWL